MPRIIKVSDRDFDLMNFIFKVIIERTGLEPLPILQSDKSRDNVRARRLFVAIADKYIRFRSDLRRYIGYGRNSDVSIAIGYFNSCVNAKQNKEKIEFMKLYNSIKEEVENKLLGL